MARFYMLTELNHFLFRSRVGNRRQRRPGRRHKSDRESLRDVTYSRQLTDSNEQERPEVTGGLDPAARIINVDSRPVEGSDRVDITIQGSDQYTWRISGYTQCSRSCGGGKVFYKRHLLF